MEGVCPTGDPCLLIRLSFVSLKENLIPNTTLIDELFASSVLSAKEKADYTNVNNIKCGKLIKEIVQKGRDACEKFLSILEKAEYGCLQKMRHQAPLEDDGDSFPKEHLKKYRTLFLEELEPTKTADYLYQYSVFDKNIHDEIEKESSRLHKAQLILHHLSDKSPRCLKIFGQVLIHSKQDFIITMLHEREGRNSLTPKEQCERCIRINFRYIREMLHFDITLDTLIQEGIFEARQEFKATTVNRGKLVKESIKKGPRACDSLLRCLESQLKEAYDKVVKTFNDRQTVDLRRKINVTIRRTDLTRLENFFISELEPLEMSDILFEESVLTVSEHDLIEENRSLKQRNEILLGCLKKRPEDQLYLFVYALMEGKKDFILEEIQKPPTENTSDQISGSESQISLIIDKGVPLLVSTGVMPKMDLKMIIEEKDNPDSNIKRVVKVINTDSSLKIEVAQDTHMEVKEATTGSIVIHLCPLTDNAVHRFLGKDGSIIQNMIEKLFTSAGLDKLLKKRRELEIVVKVIKKDPSPDEKVSRSQEPDDITRRKIQKNETFLIDELEPSQLMTYLLQKKCLTPENKSEIEREGGRKKRGIKLLQTIRTSENKEILGSFIKYLQSISRDDLVEMVQATSKDKDIHEKAEKIKEALLLNFKDIVDEIEVNIMNETLQKFKTIHDLQEDMKTFLPESGKSRSERAHNFLTFVFKHDEYVIELENVLRQNNMDHLLEVKGKMEGKEDVEEYLPFTEKGDKELSLSTKPPKYPRLSKSEDILPDSKEKNPQEAKPLKEGVLFNCKFKVVLGKEGEDKGKLSSQEPVEKEMHIEEDLPFTKKGSKELSAVGPVHGEHAHLTKSAQCPTEETLQEDEKIVVAIDFGTTYSGFAYSLTKTSEVILQKWDPKAGDKVDASLKTPTSLLLDNKNKFVAFGFDAERLYKEYVDDEKHESIRFFRNFKMKLLKKETLGSSMEIKDHMGKPLAALEVFSKSLEYMKEMVLEKIQEKYEDLVIKEERIHWIVTVPAIWDEFAKQFMREAAEKASIPSKHLHLALEPECAAVYVLSGAKLKLSGDQSEKTVGEQIFVADLGGGTADFSVVEITEHHTLKHLHYASGGEWGGKNVNKEIFDIFESIFGAKVMKKFSDMKAEILQMENDIELKKRDMKTEDKLSFSLLPSLSSLCRDVNNENFKDMIEKSGYKNVVYKTGKIIFDASLVKRIFGTVVSKIAGHMKSVLAQQPKANDIKTIILVGGFAKSDFVYEYIKKEFSDKEVIVPIDPDLAVLKGAVKFGHLDGIIEMRVCNYTYGVETNRYRLASDPQDKIKYIGNKHQCTQVFEKLITIGDKVLVNDKVEKKFNASTADMTKMKINIYRSKEKSPLFVTDEGCELFATMTVQMPDTEGGTERAVAISIEFGKTEIFFSGKDESTGAEMQVTMEMIW